MPNKSRKAKPVAQAAPVERGRSAPSKANKKRKAKKHRNNPRSSPNAEDACAKTARKDTDPAKSLAGLPPSARSCPAVEEPCHNDTPKDAERPTPSSRAASNPSTPPAAEKPWADAMSSNKPPVQPHVLSLSHDAHPSAATTTGTKKAQPSGEERTPIHQRTRIISKIKEVEFGKTGGEFVTLKEAQGVRWTDLVECGHVQTRDGSTLTTAFICLKRKALQYTVIFTTPCEDSEHTLANECMDLYLHGEYGALGELLIPLLLPIYEEADNNPVSKDNFEAFLQASETYLRLVPGTETGMLEPYPEFAPSNRVDWDLFTRDNSPTCPMWKLSDVKSFRPHSHTSMIYKIDLGGDNNFNSVIFKRMDNYRSLLWEYSSLDHCNEVGIQAPKVLGLLGVGTLWGGCVMTKIDASFCLQDYCPEGIQSTSIQPTLADRKRWFEQISDAIHTLHRDGYVWGDVKAANVLIDKDGNACLIDFEGGSDPDWIDYDLTDTKEGDLQGLGRLGDFLELDE